MAKGNGVAAGSDPTSEAVEAMMKHHIGKDIQEGIAGFGDTVGEAFRSLGDEMAKPEMVL